MRTQLTQVFFLFSSMISCATAATTAIKETPLDLIYAPWRSTYVSTSHGIQQNSCPFCTQSAAHQDETYFILKHYQHCFVILNKYPYTTGHLLIIPHRHVPTLNHLSHEERAEIMDVVVQCQSILEKSVKTDGFNLGVNQGTSAGAGIPDHVHFHLVPRFKGDTGFLTSCSTAQVVGADLAIVYQQLKKLFDN